MFVLCISQKASRWPDRDISSFDKRWSVERQGQRSPFEHLLFFAPCEISCIPTRMAGLGLDPHSLAMRQNITGLQVQDDAVKMTKKGSRSRTSAREGSSSCQEATTPGAHC